MWLVILVACSSNPVDQVNASLQAYSADIQDHADAVASAPTLEEVDTLETALHQETFYRRQDIAQALDAVDACEFTSTVDTSVDDARAMVEQLDVDGARHLTVTTTKDEDLSQCEDGESDFVDTIESDLDGLRIAANEWKVALHCTTTLDKVTN